MNGEQYTETDSKTLIPMNEYVPGYERGYVIVGIMDGNDYERLLNTGFEIEEVSNPVICQNPIRGPNTNAPTFK